MTPLLWFLLGLLMGGSGLYGVLIGMQWWHDRAELQRDRWDV